MMLLLVVHFLFLSSVLCHSDICLKFSSYIQRMTPFFELDATLTPGELRL
jgi:hypothetical protein